jgi:hypothetical protein
MNVLALQVAASTIAWTVLLWIFFISGQGLHVWLKASGMINSKLSGITSWDEWKRIKGPTVAARFFIATCLFLIFTYGKSEWFPSLQVSGGWPVKIGLAGVFGYFSDSITTEVFKRFGWDAEIPPDNKP